MTRHLLRRAPNPRGASPTNRRTRLGRTLAAVASLTLLPLAAVLGASAPAQAAPFPCDGTFYAVKEDKLQGGNIALGTWGNLGQNPGGYVDALGYNPQDNYLYAFQRLDHHLLRIHQDGTFEDLGEVPGLPAPSGSRWASGTFDDDGRMWVRGYSGNTLYGIDVTTKDVIVRSTSGAVIVAINDFAHTQGKLVTVFNKRVATIDLATGVRTLLGVAPELPDSFIAQSVWITAEGRLFVGELELLGQQDFSDHGFWEIVDPFGAAPHAIKRAPYELVGSPDDGASCPLAASPWGASGQDDDFTGTPVNGVTGGTVGSVFAGDTIDSAPAGPGNATVTLTDNGGLTGASIDPDGNIVVPPGSSAGTYVLTYEICSAAGDCTTATATVTVVEVANQPAEVDLTAPADGGTYFVGQEVPVAYSCTDADGSVASCTGTVPSGANLDTSTPGEHEFTVTATDNTGAVTTRTVRYTVVSVTGTCRATPVSLLGLAPGTANPATNPCATASTKVVGTTLTITPGIPLLGIPANSITVGALTGTTQAPTAGTVGAQAEVAKDLTISILGTTIKATGLTSSASSKLTSCGAPATLTGQSRITGLKINGSTVANVDLPATVPLGIGTLALHEQTVAGNQVTQSALHLNVAGLVDLALGQTVAGASC